MIAWYFILFLLFTNGLRIFLGLRLAAGLLGCSDRAKAADVLPAGAAPHRRSDSVKPVAVLSAGAAVFVTALSCFSVGQFYLIAAETLILVLAVCGLYGAKPRLGLFVIFFYEIGVALWEFIVSAGLGVLFRSESFLDAETPGHMAAVCIVRLLMLTVAIRTRRARVGVIPQNMNRRNGEDMEGDLSDQIPVTQEKSTGNRAGQASRIMTGIAIAGMFGVVFISGQSVIVIDDDQMTTWTILSTVILMAILFFNLSRQYEMERNIAQLETEKNALLERDYRALSSIYAANAKLFHDFHNHIDVLQGYLAKGNAAEAADYLENLCSPMQRIGQTVWTGDEALDYLINSKISLAVSRQTQVETNIEFPRHTNIRSAHLVAILGNLLDNALEATEGVKEELRFIRLTIRRINELLVIKVENGCGTPPLSNGEDLQTSKADKDMHGWGLKSVRTAAEHYDGTIETTYEGHVFRTVVTLFFEAVSLEVKLPNTY